MQLRPSLLVLCATNLVPIAGVIWLDWSVLEILLLYWTESVAIGVINIARMIASQSLFAGSAGRPGSISMLESAGTILPLRVLKLVIVPFFAVHYGMFCFGHIMAITFLLPAVTQSPGLALPAVSNPAFWFAVAAIFVIHTFSFFANFLGKGEYRRTGLITLMNRPYGRIVVMHITIIAGAGLAEHFGAPVAALIVLVLMKIAIDLKLHQKERERFAVEADT